MKFKDKLRKLHACKEAIKWVGNKSMKTAWAKCERGDWMLWLYAKLHPENVRELTLAKGHCANTVRHLMKDKRIRKAVDAAIAFGKGKITRERLDKARVSATAANANATFAAAAGYAASAACYAAAADDADAADAAAYAAAYAAAANAAADAAAAKKQNQKLTADICRKYLEI